MRRRSRILLLYGNSGTSSSPVNTAPVLANADFTMNEDATYDLDLTAVYSDADSDAANWATLEVVGASPTKITLSLNDPTPGHILVEGVLNQNDEDTFSVRVQDVNGSWSNTLLITATITPVTDAPVISGTLAAFDEDSSATLSLGYTSADGAAANWATLEQVGSNANLVLIMNYLSVDGDIRVSPVANYNGTTSFDVRVQDANAVWSNVLTVNVTVNAATDAPVISGTVSAFNEDSEATLTLGYSSADSSAANWATLEQVGTNANLTLTMNYLVNGDIRIVPDPDYNGSTSFDVRVQDSAGNWSNTLTVNVTVNAVADAPVLADAMTITCNEDSSGTVDVDTYYSSADGTARRTTSGSIVATTPTNGAVSIDQSTGVITYTPTADYFGLDSFDVYVFDANNLQSNTVTVDVTVNAVSDAPRAQDVAFTMWRNNSFVIDVIGLGLAYDYDGNIDPTTVVVTTAPSHGSTSVNGTTGEITFTPATNSTTSVTIGWKVEDTEGTLSNEAFIAIDILKTWQEQAILRYTPYDYRVLNETSGTFADSSGNSRSAASKTGGGTIGYNAATGRDGNPVTEITDTTQYIDITDTNSRNMFGGNTWSVIGFFAGKSGISFNGGTDKQFWQFRESTPANNQSFHKTLGASGILQHYLQAGATTDTNQVTTIANTTDLHMFGMVFNQPGNAISYYLDGASDGSDTGVATPGLTGTLTLRIGNNSGSCLDVRLSHWAAFNYLLAAADVLEMWNPSKWRYATLRQLSADVGCLMGVAIGNAYDSESSAFKTAATTDFSVWATENAVKYSTLYNAGIGSPNWTPLEQFMTAATTAKIAVNLHSLFWHSDSSYIGSVADTEAAAKTEITRRLQALKDKFTAEGWADPHILEVCNEILVTSQTEAVTNNRPLRQDHEWSYKFNNSSSVGTQTSSLNWIKWCYQEARRIFKKSKLVLVDFRNEKAGHWKGDAFYDLVVDLLADGVPLDGVHFQAHWEHFNASKWLPDSSLVTQINRLKALTNANGDPLHVGYSEVDFHMTSATSPVSRTADASSTGTALVASGNIFLSEMVGWKVYNLTDGTSTTISAYTSATTVTVTDTIGDTWDGDSIMIGIDITGTASSSSTGTTLVSTTSIFTSSMVGWSVYNQTDGTSAVITAYTNGTTVTLDTSIGDTWDGDSILLGQDAAWHYFVRNTIALVDYFGMWNVSDGDNANGSSGNSTIRYPDYSKKNSWYLVSRAILQAA